MTRYRKLFVSWHHFTSVRKTRFGEKLDSAKRMSQGMTSPAVAGGKKSLIGQSWPSDQRLSEFPASRPRDGTVP